MDSKPRSSEYLSDALLTTAEQTILVFFLLQEVQVPHCFQEKTVKVAKTEGER